MIILYSIQNFAVKCNSYTVKPETDIPILPRKRKKKQGIYAHYYLCSSKTGIIKLYYFSKHDSKKGLLTSGGKCIMSYCNFANI